MRWGGGSIATVILSQSYKSDYTALLMLFFLEPEAILLSQQQKQSQRLLLKKELRETDERRQIRLQKHSD